MSLNDWFGSERHEFSRVSLIRLSQHSGLATSGAVSDNGSVVAYASDEAEPGNLDIWVRDLNTGVSRRVTSDPAEELYPEGSLSPRRLGW